MGVPSSAQTSYFEVIVKIRSRSRKTSRSKAWSTSGAGARAARGGGPARRWRWHDGHSRSRPANSWRTSYTSPHGHATTMPTGRLTTASPRARQTPDGSKPNHRPWAGPCSAMVSRIWPAMSAGTRRGSRPAVEAYYVDYRAYGAISESHPISEAPGRRDPRAWIRRGAAVRSGRGGRGSESLRERGDSDTDPVAPGAFGLSVQCRRPGRDRHPRARKRRRARPAPSHAPRPPTQLGLTGLRHFRDDGLERSERQRQGRRLERAAAIPRRVVGIEGSRALDEEPHRAARRGEDELPERFGLRGRHHRQRVGRHAGGRERAVVAPEQRDAAGEVVALVAPESHSLERRARPPQKRCLVDHVPDRERVADAAQLEAQHAGQLGQVRTARVLSGAEIAALLGRGEQQPHAQARRDGRGQTLQQRQ